MPRGLRLSASISALMRWSSEARRARSVALATVPGRVEGAVGARPGAAGPAVGTGPAAPLDPTLFPTLFAAEDAGVSLSARAGEGRATSPQARPRTSELIKFLRDIEVKIFSDSSTIATTELSNVHTRSPRRRGQVKRRPPRGRPPHRSGQPQFFDGAAEKSELK